MLRFIINIWKKISGIYCIENRVNHKKYIVLAIDIYKRWNNHRRNLKNGCHESDYLQKSYNKYGDVFIYSIIEECSIEDLKEREKYYISFYDSKNNGYNLTDGGDGLLNPSEDVKIKLHNHAVENEIWKQFPNTSGKNNPMYGKHHTEDSKKKMSEAAKNRPRKNHTEETKKKMSIAASGKNKSQYGVHRYGPESAMYGRHPTDETRQKLSKARKGKNTLGNNPMSKSVQSSTGEIFTSLVEAAMWCGLKNTQQISSCCKNKVKTAGKHPETHIPLTWKYINNK